MTSTPDQDALRVANRYAGLVEKATTLAERARACESAAQQYRRDARANTESAETHRAAAHVIRDPHLAGQHAQAARDAETEAARETLAARYYEAQAEQYLTQARGSTPAGAAGAGDTQVSSGDTGRTMTASSSTSPPDGTPAPAPTRLIHDDPDWWYLGHGVTSATRRIRLYEQPGGRLIAVVTESGDGTSITNAAETVIAQIRAEHPGRQVDVIEHNPASSITGETFERIDLDRNGQAAWTRLTAKDIGSLLGPDVFTNGTGPTPRIAAETDSDPWYLEAQGGALDGTLLHFGQLAHR